MASAAEASARPFRKGPYLQNVSSSSVTVMWEASSDSQGEIWLLDDAAAQKIAVTPDEDGIYEVVLDNLEPGRRYRYAVDCDGATRTGEFATAPGAGAPFTFIVFGDTRSNPGSHQRVIDRIRREVPDFLLSTGDMVDDGGRERQWQEFFDIERELLAENVMFPSLGNHDRQGRGRTAHNFRKYFALPENSPDPERYYAFTYAGARFLILDSNAYSFSLTDQTAWLEAQLRSTELDPNINQVFVSMHHPPYSISLHGGQKELRERWTPLFEQYRVTAVFAGHDHVYSRGHSGGVRYFVSGGAGAPLYPRSRRPSQSDSEVIEYFERVNHYLRVHVIGEFVEVSAVRADGSHIETLSWETPNTKKRPPSPQPDMEMIAAVGDSGGTEPAPASITLPGEVPDSGFGALGILGASLILLAGAVLMWAVRS